MRRNLCLSSALGVLFASSIFAQQPAPVPPPPPPPAQPVPPPPAQPAPQAQKPANIVYPTSLYQMNDVAQSLKLNEKQINQLNDITANLQKVHRDAYADIARMDATQRPRALQDLNRRYATEWMKGAGGVLGVEQQQRYRQLQLQYEGFNAFLDPENQRALNLTLEQQKSLADSVRWNESQWQAIRAAGAENRDRGLQLYKDYRQAYQERVEKFLTPEQQKTWRGMVGDPYSFSPTFAQPAR